MQENVKIKKGNSGKCKEKGGKWWRLRGRKKEMEENTRKEGISGEDEEGGGGIRKGL